MVTIKEVTYKNYGKCLSFTNETMEMLVTISVGPRIIKCNLLNKENLMFNDVERQMQQDVSSLYGEGKKWYIYGGHRLWMSPESLPETYYPDNGSVVYSVTAAGATFTPAVQEPTGLKFSVTVEMDEKEPRVTLTHSITNTQRKPVTGAAWCLSVMAPNGAALVPQPQEDTGLLGNRVLALWPYTDMTDSRVFWGNKYIMVRQNPEITKNIKLGINNTLGKVAYINHGQALVKTYHPNHPNGTYPDFGVSTEVFANGLFLEAETLSELKTFGKNESVCHVEEWTLFDNVAIPEKTNDSVEALGERLFS